MLQTPDLFLLLYNCLSNVFIVNIEVCMFACMHNICLYMHLSLLIQYILYPLSIIYLFTFIYLSIYLSVIYLHHHHYHLPTYLPICHLFTYPTVNNLSPIYIMLYLFLWWTLNNRTQEKEKCVPCFVVVTSLLFDESAFHTCLPPLWTSDSASQQECRSQVWWHTGCLHDRCCVSSIAFGLSFMGHIAQTSTRQCVFWFSCGLLW